MKPASLMILQAAMAMAASDTTTRMLDLIPRRQKYRQQVTVLHDCAYGGTYITPAGIERMKARRNAYIADTDLLSKTAQRKLKLVKCKGNRMHGITVSNSKYHVQYNKFAAIRANFSSAEL